MESEPTPDEARAALTDAESSRAALAGRITAPTWFFTTLGGSIALQVATAAAAFTVEAAWALAAGIAGAVALVAAGAVQLLRFRRLNGVWLGGLASRVILGTSTLAGVSYAAALGVATWAAYERAWPVTVLAALVGGAAYALSGRRWLAAYQADPARHGRGEPVVHLAALAVLAIAGAVVLLAAA